MCNIEQVIRVIIATGRITAELRSFSRIGEVAPLVVVIVESRQQR